MNRALLTLVLLLPGLLVAQEREEPDYAFLSGGPYTQKKGTFQLISSLRFDTERGARDQKFRSALLRAEYGATDRLEMDLIVSGAGRGERREDRIIGFFTRADSVVGLRYRFLDEGRGAPMTLTGGPQLVLPTGKRESSTGTGRLGYAWDLSAARDWGGPGFVYLSLNYAATPGFRDPTPGSHRKFLRHALAWGAAWGLRPLERHSARNRHQDVHLFLEVAGTREDDVSPGELSGRVVTSQAVSFAPGVRYGFLTPRGKLFEIGVAVPVGLNRTAPDYGFILQIQFEALVPGRRAR